MKFEVMMGLEVHAELSTKSKLFCSCSAAFGGEPNTRVCPVCSGMPGALPRLNREAVQYAMMLGLALGCEIAELCKFDRKNYFYPDLPKAYQISQLYSPICRDGGIDIGGKTIGIREIHIEEDAGKLIHDAQSLRSTLGGSTLADFNRCSVPLLEIVSQPDLSTTDEVTAYLERLRETMLYLGISDCKMQEGSMRADVNLSLRRHGEPPGVRTETKNLNSFKAIARAIEYETERQMEILEDGGTITQETRRWDDEAGESYSMRSKEDAQDYRYFPEPDLLPVKIDREWVARVRESLPEMPQVKRERYVQEYKISEFEASVLTSHKAISDLFEEIAAKSKNPVESAHMVSGEIMRLLGSTGTLPEDLAVDAGKLAMLVEMLAEGKINRDAYKTVIDAVFTQDVDPERFVADKGLQMINDDSLVSSLIDEVMAGNPGAVDDYRGGKEKAFGFLMGQVMKRLKGAGNPETVRRMLVEKLDNS